MEANLTPKQKIFCDEYLIDLNATQAAIRAGYSANTAHCIGCENLSKPNIKDYIDKRMLAREKRTDISQDRVLQEYAKLAFFDPRKLYDNDGKPIPIHELDADTAAVIAGLDITEEYEGRGEDRRFVGYTKKYKLSDKKGALDSIARHLGMFNDKLDLSAGLTVTFVDNIKPDDEEETLFGIELK